MNTIFELASKKGVIAVSETAINAMLAYQQNANSAPESGGVLIGRRLIDSSDWIVDSVTEPAKSDKRSRYSFFRSKRHHQMAIDNAWRCSEGAIGYLGEWHTHPEDHPRPSETDLHYWNKAMKEFTYDGDDLFFAILGTTSLSMFQGARSTGKVVQLKPQKPHVKN